MRLEYTLGKKFSFLLVNLNRIKFYYDVILNYLPDSFKVRIGAHCGEVTAGLIGTRKLLFDIFGNTVNVASRMDSTGICGCIQVTEDLKNQLTAIRTARGEAQR